MVVPMPFTRAIFLYGDPIVVPRDGDVEEWRARVESALNALERHAEVNFDQLWRNDER